MNKTKIHIALSPEGKKLAIIPTQPVMFLAGPIRNAPKWHYDAIRIALEADSNTFVTVPIRDVPEDIKPFVVNDINANNLFFRQRAWELHYLELAMETGCTVFWLPKEADVKEFQDKIYAHITMMELGSALEKKRVQGDKMKLVIGTDGKFPEWETIELDIQYASIKSNSKIPICYTLEETINTALKLIHG